MVEEKRIVGKASKDALGHVEKMKNDESVGNAILNKEKKKDNLYEEIQIPEGINAVIEDDVLVMSKDGKEIRRTLIPLLEFKVNDGKIIVKAINNRKIEKKLFGTFKSHINNMIKGLSDGFEYILRVSNVHFPMNVSFDANKKIFVIKNFLGEKKDRVISTIDGVDVKIEGEDVIVSSYDIEKAGQVATSIEKGARVKGKDRRVFQEGIHLISKPRKNFL